MLCPCHVLPTFRAAHQRGVRPAQDAGRAEQRRAGGRVQGVERRRARELPHRDHQHHHGQEGRPGVCARASTSRGPCLGCGAQGRGAAHAATGALLAWRRHAVVCAWVVGMPAVQHCSAGQARHWRWRLRRWRDRTSLDVVLLKLPSLPFHAGPGLPGGQDRRPDGQQGHGQVDRAAGGRAGRGGAHRHGVAGRAVPERHQAAAGGRRQGERHKHRARRSRTACGGGGAHFARGRPAGLNCLRA